MLLFSTVQRKLCLAVFTQVTNSNNNKDNNSNSNNNKDNGRRLKQGKENWGRNPGDMVAIAHIARTAFTNMQLNLVIIKQRQLYVLPKEFLNKQGETLK